MVKTISTALHCPRLEQLEVPLSNITPSTFALPAPKGHPQADALRPHPLERLGVGRPKLHDEAALAAYLSSLFPKLEFIEHCWDGVSPDGEDWVEMEEEEERITDRWNALFDAYEAFVRIRAQERSWRAVQTESRSQDEHRSLGG